MNPRASAAANGSDDVIAAHGLRFAYPGDGFRLRVETLRIPVGAHAACIGPSGCGKTTLINLLTGIVAPDAGRIELCGQAITDLSEDARRALRIRRVGLVFQEFELLDYLTAYENILLPYYVAADMPADGAARERARSIATAMGVASTLRRRPGRLSQGERQRIAVCRALVTQPDLIVCDEPTGNLDPASTARTLDLLFAQAAAHDATLLVVTHNHALLDRFDRVIDMSAPEGAS